MNFAEFVIYIYNFAIIIGGFLAFVLIIYSGIKLMNSQGNPSALSEAKKRIINGFIGLTVLLCSYILLTTINTDLIKIQNIKLPGTEVSVPIITPGTIPTTVKTFQFQEVPIGSITEHLLAGTSSTINALPCYAYEHKAYDSDGNIIIGNTADQNGDKKIDEKDILLDKDIFYCIKLLDDAIKKKTEQHLNYLIEELNKEMEKCSCQGGRCYYRPLEEPEGYECVINPARSYIPSGCSYCNKCDVMGNDCGCCGGEYGCEKNMRGTSNEEGVIDYGTFKQYKFDVCQNRLEINCKKQNMEMLISGEKPDDICYEREFIKKTAPEEPFLLTFELAIERLNQFKNYFDGKVKELESAEKTLKNVENEITWTEFNKTQDEERQNAITKTENDYTGKRYCSLFQCKETRTKDQKECLLGLLTKEKRVCNIADSKEYHLFDGDPATFYINSDYLKETEMILDVAEDNQQFKTCSVAEGDETKLSYSGLIPIGELVDNSEAWGKEVVSSMQKLINEVDNIKKAAEDITDLPKDCSCSNCQNKNPAQKFVCASRCCPGPNAGKCACSCFCPSWECKPCQDCEVSEVLRTEDGAQLNTQTIDPCFPTSYCPPYGSGAGTITIPLKENERFSCPYGRFCSLVKSIYKIDEADNNCFEDTLDETEKDKRKQEFNKIGYLQRFAERERRLFILANVYEIKDDNYDKWESVDGIVNLIDRICTPYYKKLGDSEMKCDDKLNYSNSVEKRFVLLDRLTYVRNKLNKCITGYNQSYKDNSALTRVFTCKEGINMILLDGYTITPDFPYPRVSTYYNCYPYNISEKIKSTCFGNKDKPGSIANPGCPMLTQDYMDNYYCCE